MSHSRKSRIHTEADAERVVTSITAFKHQEASSLRCDDLVVRFGASAAAIDGISCEFAAGRITSLVGPSGCGKTTLLRALAGLQNPTSGLITIDPPAQPQRGEIAFVFQQPTLLPWRTARDNVRLPLQLGADLFPHADPTRLAEDELREMDLKEDAILRYPRELSGGMRMRVSLARALVTRPSVLLLDEPFAALDDMLRVTLGELLLRRWAERPFTMVLVTHNIGEAAMLSHQVLVMREGKVTHAFENDLPWPRNEAVRTSAEFGAFYRSVSDALREEATPWR
jgi:NitT/TauT family transport system ATP-binding protein